MAGLCVYLFGSPVVQWAGQSLDIARRRVRALLYRLAAGERPVPREHLCYLFWPDIPEATARRKLTGLLAHLRRGLPEPALLVATRDHIELADDRVWTDGRAFGRLYATGAQTGSVDALREAVGRRG